MAKRLEAQNQEAFFKWLSFQCPDIRKVTFAIPNGGTRNLIEAKNLKKQGVTAGVPDVFIAYPIGKYHGLFIEFKSGKNKTTQKQKDMIFNLEIKGYFCVICYSWQEACARLNEYLYSSMGEKPQSIKGKIACLITNSFK